MTGSARRGLGQPLGRAGRLADALRTGNTMSSTPAARKTTPPISRPAAAHGSAGSVAATFTRTLTGADPSAFMATTVHRPLVTGQASVCVLGPVACTAQM